MREACSRSPGGQAGGVQVHPVALPGPTRPEGRVGRAIPYHALSRKGNQGVPAELPFLLTDVAIEPEGLVPSLP